jgi:anaerobic magnesium-protoporphyrin IX monomethyl ester cyclase
MKVCLIRPPTITTAEAVGEDAAPPLGVAYLAGALVTVGHDVTIIDALGEALSRYDRIDYLPTGLRHGLTDDEILSRIPRDVEVIGISIMFSLEWPFTRDLTMMVRKAFPNAFLVAGGEHITALPEFSLRECPAIDACALGEGEQIIVNLVEALQNGSPLEEVDGLYLRNKDSSLVRTRSQKRQRALSTMSRPAWDLAPIDEYLDKGFMTGVDFGRSMPIMASRGCPYRCTFCSNPVMWGPLWRVRPAVDVVDEIEDYHRRYNATNFDFYDLTAIVKRDWIVEFCNLLIAREIKVTWQLPSGTRSEAIDEEVCRLLHQSGCRYINYAPESGSEEMLRKMKKQVSKPAMMKSIRAALAIGMNVKSNFILGFPTEQLSHFKDTYLWVLRMAWAGVHDISVFPFSPYPGSQLFQELSDEGKITLNDTYFYSLSQYTDPRYARTYCRNLSKNVLRLLCLGTMMSFYLLSYARRPSRLVAMFGYLRTNDAKTKLAAALIRVRKKRKELADAA